MSLTGLSNNQSKVVLPDDECERLNAVNALSLFDTDPERNFDRITRIAKLCFQTRFAGISLVDEDRVWYKATAGVSFVESPREVSFCAQTIMHETPLIVQDASKHPLFRENPLVTGQPNIRFYAGIPLNTREGSKVGALCVIDTRLRPDWSPIRTAMLADMADWVCQEIDSRSRRLGLPEVLASNSLGMSSFYGRAQLQAAQR